MFARTVTVECIATDNTARVCPIAWIDNFAMRNFTNDAIFDDTLPIADGLLEIGTRVPIDRLTTAMQVWFRKKNYITASDVVRITEVPR
jgi:hypothetical protein